LRAAAVELTGDDGQ